VPTFDIDRMTVELPGAVAGDPREVALQIVAELAAAGGLPAAGDYPALRLQVPARPGEPAAALTRRIVEQAQRELRRGNG
jgi:hypothetical protein